MPRDFKGLVLILVLVVCLPSFAQADSCSKPKLSVNADEIFDEVYDFFLVQYPAHTDHGDMLPGFESWLTREDWLIRVHDYVMQFLQESNPTIQFVSKGGDDCDYSFTYSIQCYPIDWEDPASGIVQKDNGYRVRATLSTNNACGENRQIANNFGKDLDLFQAIRNAIANFGYMEGMLFHYEKEHPSPPRGPKLLVTVDKNYVSPLENERQIEINLEVRNCKNIVVYEKIYPGQKVALSYKSQRSELKNNIKQMAAQTIQPGNPLIIGIMRPKTASIFYKLKKGMSPEVEEIAILTCGRDRIEKKTLKLNINGLEISVKPRHAMVFSNEQTTIDIYFYSISPNGTKRPIADKKLDLSIKGIKDGSISPSKEVTTDSSGKATLEYEAGNKDELISIIASYQPKDYPDSVQGEAEIKVSNREWYGTLTIEQASTFHCDIEPTKETGWQEMTEEEERTQRAFLTLTSDDFDLARIPAAGAFPQMIEVSGTIHCNISQDRHVRGEAPSTECVSKGERKRVSPGNWMTDHKTTTGQASKPVKGEHVKILFAKKAGADKSQMQDLARQMKDAAASGNVARIQELQGQLMGMMQGGGGDSIPLRIRVMINIPSRDEVLVTSERKVYDVCLGRLTTDDSNSDTKEIQLILPMMVDLKGNYIKGKNGDDRVEARMENTDHKPSGRSLGKQKCPDIDYRVRGELNMNRRRK